MKTYAALYWCLVGLGPPFDHWPSFFFALFPQPGLTAVIAKHAFLHFETSPNLTAESAEIAEESNRYNITPSVTSAFSAVRREDF